MIPDFQVTLAHIAYIDELIWGWLEVVANESYTGLPKLSNECTPSIIINVITNKTNNILL